MSKLSFWRTICLACVLCAATAIASPAQTFKTLVNFNGTNGAMPYYGSLVQGTDGDFYGTTAGGGPNGYGTAYKIRPGSKLTTLYFFCSQTNCTDGAGPSGSLVLATNGNFYGTTFSGGANDNCTGSNNGCGTVFEITAAGKLTTLYSFCAQLNCTDGLNPDEGLVQATNGNFYGTTTGGGANGGGTVFEITATGKLSTLYSFCAQTNCSDGDGPQAALIQATDGNFYGATFYGGNDTSFGDSGGTLFKVTPGGALTTLYKFCSENPPPYLCIDGYGPSGALVQAGNGTFYGTTSAGGYPELGTVFEITPTGALTTLYDFTPPGPIQPLAGLVLATDGNLYGTTFQGGTDGCGTVFRITPHGTLTTLHSFDFTDGCYLYGGLVQATDGSFYGTTWGGGAYTSCEDGNGCGTVFHLAVGLGPFVEAVPTSGKVGTRVIILGNNLTGAIGVTFNNTPATSFAVNATGTAITTTVPTGATTGYVKVTTASDNILTSNVQFRVP